MREGTRLRSFLPALLLAALAALAAPALAADEMGDLFQAPAAGAAGAGGGAGGESVTPPTVAGTGSGQGPSLLQQYQNEQKKLSFSWDLTAGGGMYGGLKSLSGLADPAANFAYTPAGTLTLTSTVDLRPFDYLRVHESSYVSYPNTAVPGYDFNLDINSIVWFNELFVDYDLPSGPSVRMGKYGLSWGDARILGVANLPERVINTANLMPSVEVLPSWLESPTSSIWLKGALPVGNFSATGLIGLPSGTYQGLSVLPYGFLAEYTAGKSYLGLSGLYEEDRTPRTALMLKTSRWNIDFYVDSCLAFSSLAGVVPSAVGGIYYAPATGPDIKLTAELCWNGEPVSGLVQDALEICGGLSHAMAIAWSSVGGTNLTIGGTWYQSWSDGSGALVPALSYSIAPGVSLKGVFPFVYGPANGYYVRNPPAEANGYALGGALMIVLKQSF
jgi:hypothetical protein